MPPKKQQKSIENKEPTQPYSALIWAGLTFILPLSFFFWYDASGATFSFFGIELKKLTQEQVDSDVPEKDLSDVKPIFQAEKKDSSLVINNPKETNSLSRKPNQDTLLSRTKKDKEEVQKQLVEQITYDLSGTNQRILLMGDSECGGLCYPLNDYCKANGHELVATLVWNSAGIFNYAYSDTVVKVIEKYKPTYIFIVLGLNELYVRDLSKRQKAAAVLARKLEGIPYTWVGPANYMEDFGINNVYKQAAKSGAFYLTKQLSLPKGKDKRHPNKEGYRIWMDSLATWVSHSARYPLPLAPPGKRNRGITGKIISLNAAKYRGY
jgi:hypothetical protein